MSKIKTFFQDYLDTFSHMHDSMFVPGGRCNW